MKRLTRNVSSTDKPVYACNKPAQDFNGNELIDANQKLGPLEDFEKEIGVDLIKLLSAKEIYYMDWASYQSNDDSLKIAKTFRVYLNLTENKIEFFENEYSDTLLDLDLQNYGRNDIWGGWAFTKGELE